MTINLGTKRRYHLYPLQNVMTKISNKLCRVLSVNRSTYYKHFHSESAPKTIENQNIKQTILHIYDDYDKRISAYKLIYILGLVSLMLHHLALLQITYHNTVTLPSLISLLH